MFESTEKYQNRIATLINEVQSENEDLDFGYRFNPMYDGIQISFTNGDMPGSFHYDLEISISVSDMRNPTGNVEVRYEVSRARTTDIKKLVALSSLINAVVELQAELQEIGEEMFAEARQYFEARMAEREAKIEAHKNLKPVESNKIQGRIKWNDKVGCKVWGPVTVWTIVEVLNDRQVIMTSDRRRYDFKKSELKADPYYWM